MPIRCVMGAWRIGVMPLVVRIMSRHLVCVVSRHFVRVVTRHPVRVVTRHRPSVMVWRRKRHFVDNGHVEVGRRGDGLDVGRFRIDGRIHGIRVGGVVAGRVAAGGAARYEVRRGCGER